MANRKPLTYELMVSGDVQGVGYRRAVQRIARKMNVKGFVKNLPDGRVRIVVQCGDLEVLDEFAKAISLRSPPAFVESVERKVLKSKTSFKYFKIESGPFAEEMQEGFGSMESQFKDYRGEFGSFAQRTDSNFNTLANRYDKISETLALVLEESSKTRGDFKQALEKMTNQTEELKDALGTLTTLAKEYFDDRRSNNGTRSI